MRTVAAAVIGVTLALGSPSAMAQDSGLVGLHTLVRSGSKLCMKDHFHDGSSSGQPSRKAAEVAAIRFWQDFTGWEYGGAWGSFAMAESKSVQCSGSGGNWACNVSARPCRRR